MILIYFHKMVSYLFKEKLFASNISKKLQIGNEICKEE